MIALFDKKFTGGDLELLFQDTEVYARERIDLS
jgi:hypothetical protein